MIKYLLLFLLSYTLLFSSEYILDNTKSEVYYDAKKEQFFSTHTIISINKSLNGLIQKVDDKYSGKLSIQVTGFDSQSSMRDDNVDEMLQAEAYPFITYKYTIVDNHASGIMTINNVSKKINFPVKIKEDDNGLYIEGSVKIKYTDFGLQTPSNLIVTAHEDLIIGAKLYFIK